MGSIETSRDGIDLDGYDSKAGALNLLQTCVGVRQGDSVLLIGENGPKAFFDPVICDHVAASVRELGASAEVVIAPEISSPEDFPSSLTEMISRNDHTIFFSRIGDQVRFSDLDGAGTKTMCYVRNPDYLGEAFSRVPYGVFVEVHDLLMDAISKVDTITVRCPKGTDLSIDMRSIRPTNSQDKGPETEFTVKLFPVLIHPPLSCETMSGKVALGDFLMSTSTTLYDDSLVVLKEPLLAVVENGRIVDIEGDTTEAERIRNHMLILGGNDEDTAFRINSWHTGIYPPTFYSEDPTENIESWADIVFGNPRYTHIHMCGPNPGQIALSLFETVIEFDGVRMWDAGNFTFLDRSECQALLEKYNCPPVAFETRWDIGI